MFYPEGDTIFQLGSVRFTIVSRLSTLPHEVLKLIMQQVPLEERLTSCCLVSRRLHAAAVAATQQLKLGAFPNPWSDQRAAALWAWLPQYGHHLTSLKLQYFPQLLQQLPCPNLQELSLKGGGVQLGPTLDGQPGVVQGCSKLTRLKLRCQVVDALAGVVVDCLSSLSSLVHLQHLEVGESLLIGRGYQPARVLKGWLSVSTLPQLTHLTYLNVMGLSAENLAQLGGLTNLQELVLPAAADGGHTILGPSSAPGLAFPASLVSLGLSDIDVGVLSLVPAGLRDLSVGGRVEGPAEGPRSMFSHIAGLQQLTQLDMYLENWPPVGPAYSALTASSNLQSLTLSQPSLPAGVWPHVFPATRKLLHLTHLWFGNHEVHEMPSAFGAADLSCLVSCCPKLCQLHTIFVQHGLHVSELHKLASLRSMYLEFAPGEEEEIDRSMEGLAAVTQLKHMGIDVDGQDVAVASLLPLTSLTALKHLEICFKQDLDNGSDVLFLHVSVKAGRICMPWFQLV